MVSNSISRRDLFNGLRGQAAPIRPPFSIAEAGFEEACTGCNDCISACPENILLRGRGGYPYVDFSKASCSFCAACADVCKAGAFGDQRAADQAWDLHAVIGQTCLEYNAVSCRACESWCEVEAIRFRPALGGRSDILLDQSLCTGCGACVATCPQGAISICKPDPTPANKMEASA